MTENSGVVDPVADATKYLQGVIAREVKYHRAVAGKTLPALLRPEDVAAAEFAHELVRQGQHLLDHWPHLPDTLIEGRKSGPVT